MRTALLVLLLSAAPLPALADAPRFDWQVGPSLPFLEYDVGASHPLQVAPGAGLQVSATLEQLQRPIGGKRWDLLDLAVVGFGAVNTLPDGTQAATFSAAVGACTMSNLVCLLVGRHLFGTGGPGGGVFIGLGLSLNVAFAPEAPAPRALAGPGELPRANTLTFP